MVSNIRPYPAAADMTKASEGRKGWQEAPEGAEKEPESPEKPDTDRYERTEKCTMNTDKVDEEIRQLKKRKEDLSKELQHAADDPKKREKLQRELSQVEQELRVKDTDSYRRQHASKYSSPV